MDGLFGVTRGVICQQVNCQNAMGRGISKAIMDKYPEVAEDYHKSFKWADAKNLFGCYRLVKVDEDLYVANIYSQFEYGNPQITGRVYTDADKLVECVQAICDSHPELPVFLPRSKDTDNDKDGIGCGLGGESWEKLSGMFKGLDKRNLYLLDTLKGIVHPLEEQLRVSYLVLGAPVYYQSVKSPEEARLVINSIAGFMNQMVENGTFPDHCSTASLEYFDKDEEDWLEWEDEYGYTLDEHFESMEDN